MRYDVLLEFTGNTQNSTTVKINRHTLLATTKRQYISHLTHTTYLFT